MRVAKKKLDLPRIKLVPIGDIHLGHVACDLDLLENTINYVAQHREALWFGMGDYCDAITAKDKRYNPEEIDPKYPTPDVQYREITKIFEPIKDKCIGLLDGNHDYCHWLYHNHNYVDSMSYNLNVPYLTTDAYIRLSMPRLSPPENNRETHEFNLYAHHGWTNARKDGYKVNTIQDLANTFPGLNLYLMGHVHSRGEAPLKVQLTVNNALEIVHREQRFVFTGSYIRGYVDGINTYIEMKSLPPTALGSPVICIDSFREYGKKSKPSSFTVHIEEVTEVE